VTWAQVRQVLMWHRPELMIKDGAYRTATYQDWASVPLEPSESGVPDPQTRPIVTVSRW
jgi:hypothetical protein